MKKNKKGGVMNKRYHKFYKENEKNCTVLKFSMQCPLIPSVEGKLEEFCSVIK